MKWRAYLQFIADVRPGPKMLLVVCLSFCAGLAVFYAPGRQYGLLPSIWLPETAHTDASDAFALPTKIDPLWKQGVRFLPYEPGEVELVEVAVQPSGYAAAKCPDLYAVSEQHPSGCSAIGKVAGESVYAIQRQRDSDNLHAYMVRSGTLIAITGVYSHSEALAYMEQLIEVSRRDVDRRLSQYRDIAEQSLTALRQQREERAYLEQTAYQRLAFEPVLPATLPAGWVQYSVRVSGDIQRPTAVDILYKKGHRLLGMRLVARHGFTLGANGSCGPTPGVSGLVACHKDKADQYSGGVNTKHQTSLYLYKQVGNTVAILQLSARSDEGQAMIFDEDSMHAQSSIAESLRSADRQRLQHASFVGSADESYSVLLPQVLY